jgi:1-acyl-sn-glycerol-3-phosphate acyltransferase
MVAGLDATGELADKGFSILFYPEGEMQRERKQNPFLPGLGYLAKELRLPVVMVKLDARQYQEIWPPPPPGKEATDLASVTPIAQGSVEVRIADAVIDSSLNSDQLTHSIEEQFNQL